MVGAAILAVPFFTPPAVTSAGVEAPVAEIMNPENLKVFRPGDFPLVDGNAFGGLGIHAVKLEFWLLNKMERAVLAECGACKTSTSTYWAYEADGLLPGYYIVRAYAVDNAGNFSAPAQRGFVYGLQQVNPPKPPKVPVPGAPGLPENQLPAPTIDQPPGIALPGATEPVPITGTTSGPGQQVRLKETKLGNLGTVRSDERGFYEFETRLPSGTYSFRVRATDEDGGRSRWSRIHRITIDADRPSLGLGSPERAVYSMLNPVVIEGTLFDEQAPARVRLEYWLLDDVVLVQQVTGTITDAGTMAWQARPQGLQPGYYHVRLAAWDQAGNPSHNAETTFVYAI